MLVQPNLAPTKKVTKMNPELHTAEAWMAATPTQRREFIAKVRVEVRARDSLAKQERLRIKEESKVVIPKKKKPTRRQRSTEAKILSQIKQYDRPTKVKNSGVTSASFLSSYEWRKVRMVALKMYGPKCQCCGATPADGAVMNVDHIKPRKLYPSLALDVTNLQILCHPCNHGKGNWDQTDWRA